MDGTISNFNIRVPGTISIYGVNMHLPENFAHSFIVRVRLEEAANSIKQASWRGQIEHIPGGERHYFKEPDEISSIILSYLKEEPSAINLASD